MGDTDALECPASIPGLSGGCSELGGLTSSFSSSPESSSSSSHLVSQSLTSFPFLSFAGAAAVLKELASDKFRIEFSNAAPFPRERRAAAFLALPPPVLSVPWDSDANAPPPDGCSES